MDELTSTEVSVWKTYKVPWLFLLKVLHRNWTINNSWFMVVICDVILHTFRTVSLHVMQISKDVTANEHHFQAEETGEGDG